MTKTPATTDDEAAPGAEGVRDVAAEAFLATVTRYLGLDVATVDEAKYRIHREGHPDLGASLAQLLAVLGDVATPDEVQAVQTSLDRYHRTLEGSVFGLHPALREIRELDVGGVGVVALVDACVTDWPRRVELADVERALDSLPAKRRRLTAAVERAIQALDVDAAAAATSQLDNDLPAEQVRLQLRRAELLIDKAEVYAAVPRQRGEQSQRRRDEAETRRRDAEVALEEATRECERVRFDTAGHASAWDVAVERVKQARAEHAALLEAEAAARVERVRHAAADRAADPLRDSARSDGPALQ